MRRLFKACVAFLCFICEVEAHNDFILGEPLSPAFASFQEPWDYEENNFKVAENRENKHYFGLETGFGRYSEGYSGFSYDEVDLTASHKFESYTKRGILLTRISGTSISGNGVTKSYLNFADVRIEGRFRRRPFALSFFSDDWLGTEWFIGSVKLNNFGDNIGTTWVLSREYISYTGIKFNFYNVFLEDSFFGSVEAGIRAINGSGYFVQGFTSSAYLHFRVYKNIFLMGYFDEFVRRYSPAGEAISYIDYYAKIGGFLRQGNREFSIAFFWGENQSVVFLPLENYKLQVKKKGVVAGYGVRHY